MSSIKFKNLKWKNFLSTGNQYTEFDFRQNKTTLIIGENGAGKSQILDALSFVLYGRAYRNINKNGLTNSITRKNLKVVIEIEVKEDKYKIKRGISPNIFEIYKNGNLIQQNSTVKDYQEYLEKNILRLNYKSFTQIVLIGSANFVPFMKLKPQDRRDVIEYLLDINIFSKMYVLLKEKINKNKDRIQQSKYDIELLNQKISLTKKHIEEIINLRKNSQEAKKIQIDQLRKKIEECNNEKKQIEIISKSLSSSIINGIDLNKKIKKFRDFESQLKIKLKRHDNRISFFKENNVCPTCDQLITEKIQEENIELNIKKKKEIELGIEKIISEYLNIEVQLEEINKIQDEINTLNNKYSEQNFNINSFQRQIEYISIQIENEKKELTSNTELENEIEKLENNVNIENENYKEFINKKTIFENALILLKDTGIKANIIRQYVPIINKLMNKYLASMDFFVQFELDENFNETIKSRFRDIFTYESFSEGEKSRIDLALILTWRAVSKLRNSVSTNILLLDEVFDSSLDLAGTDELLKIINQLSNESHIIVISHKGDLISDRFENIIKFEKVKNFSYKIG